MLKHKKLIQLAIILYFMTFFLGSLGMIYVVPVLGGNSKQLGMVLGIAESTAGIYSGVITQYIGHKTTFNIFGIIGITLIFLLYLFKDFLLKKHDFLGLIIYYFGMVGWGGAYNMMYLVAENETPPEMLGATFSLGLSLGLLSASLAP